MSLSAQSQVALMSANEARSRKPLGELHEGRWCCVSTQEDTHRTHGLMPLICKLSGKVGQNVTNKRDFQMLVAARGAIDQQVHDTPGLGSDTQITTKHQVAMRLLHPY